MKISSKQITNSIIWNKNNNNKQNKQPSLPVARPALSSSSPLPYILLWFPIYEYSLPPCSRLLLHSIYIQGVLLTWNCRENYFTKKNWNFRENDFTKKRFEAIVDLLKYPHPFWTPCKYVSDFCRAPQKQNKHNSILADQQQSYMMTKMIYKLQISFF